MRIPIHVIGKHDEREQAGFSPSHGKVIYPLSWRLCSLTKGCEGYGAVSASLCHILGCPQGILQSRQNTR